VAFALGTTAFAKSLSSYCLCLSDHHYDNWQRAFFG